MMQKFRLLACVLAAMFAAALPPRSLAADTSASAAQALINLENDWCTALLKNDVTALAAILADDLTAVEPSGAVRDKPALLSEAKTTKVSVCKSNHMKARVYGDAAVVTGVTTYKDSSDGGEYQFTDTYVRHNGRWQCVATHETPSKK